MAQSPWTSIRASYMRLGLLCVIILVAAQSTPAAAVDCSELLWQWKHERLISELRAYDAKNFYWDYPSDHIPVPAEMRIAPSGEKMRLLTWNVLNKNYLDLIMKGTQGLQVSAITRDDQRSQKVLNILNGLQRDLHFQLIALQEVDEELLPLLETWAVRHGLQALVARNPKSRDGATIDHGMVFFEPNLLEPLPQQSEIRFFAGPKKYIQKVAFKTRTGFHFNFVNVHREFTDEDVFPRFMSEVVAGSWVITGDYNWTLPQVEQFLAAYPALRLMPKIRGDFSNMGKERELQDHDYFIFSGNIQIKSDNASAFRIKNDLSL